jgi:hypothetical protein
MDHDEVAIDNENMDVDLMDPLDSMLMHQQSLDLETSRRDGVSDSQALVESAPPNESAPIDPFVHMADVLNTEPSQSMPQASLKPVQPVDDGTSSVATSTKMRQPHQSLSWAAVRVPTEPSLSQLLQDSQLAIRRQSSVDIVVDGDEQQPRNSIATGVEEEPRAAVTDLEQSQQGGKGRSRLPSWMASMARSSSDPGASNKQITIDEDVDTRNIDAQQTDATQFEYIFFPRDYHLLTCTRLFRSHLTLQLQRMHKKNSQRMAEVIDESSDDEGAAPLAVLDATAPPQKRRKKSTPVPILYTDTADPNDLRMGRVIAFDVETTGFSSKDCIIEIGAVEIINGFRTGM